MASLLLDLLLCLAEQWQDRGIQREMKANLQWKICLLKSPFQGILFDLFITEYFAWSSAMPARNRTLAAALNLDDLSV